MEFEIEFYTEGEKKPVEEFLDKVLKRNRSLWTQTVAGLQKIKYRQYHKEPLSKALGGGLHEIRVQSKNDILRIIYTFTKGRKIILLHGFIKKTQKTSKAELGVAKQRLRRLERN